MRGGGCSACNVIGGMSGGGDAREEEPFVNGGGAVVGGNAIFEDFKKLLIPLALVTAAKVADKHGVFKSAKKLTKKITSSSKSKTAKSKRGGGDADADSAAYFDDAGVEDAKNQGQVGGHFAAMEREAYISNELEKLQEEINSFMSGGKASPAKKAAPKSPAAKKPAAKKPSAASSSAAKKPAAKKPASAAAKKPAPKKKAAAAPKKK